MPTEPDFLTVEAACALIGGDQPISRSTYYRGVKAGRYPKPQRVSPGCSRVRRAELIAALNRTHLCTD